jgi:hypothetical protein
MNLDKIKIKTLFDIRSAKFRIYSIHSKTTAAQNALYVWLTARHDIHLLIEISATALEIRAVQSLRCIA